jgi:oligoribonuclease NrnB/cAMP/cGMP phosphodiesterase (DHH superfamily)
MTTLMTFNEFIADIADYELKNYVQNNIADIYTYQDIDEELKKYLAGDYEIHLEYLIDTWKKLIDEYSDKVDYEFQGTFKELCYYIEDLPCFDYEWLDDIFERKILDTNVCLK